MTGAAMTAAHRLYEPLRACGYALGVFPYTVPPSAPHAFRLHWFGAALKAVHVLLFWSAAAKVSAGLLLRSPPAPDHRQQQALDKKLATTSPVNVYELYVYMSFTTIATTALCQVHLLMPSVVALVGECLLRPRVHPDGRTGPTCAGPRWPPAPLGGRDWPPFKAFTVVAFVVYEFGIYYALSTSRFNNQFFICLFSFLSNIDCIVVEQFFYIACLTVCVRLKRIHEEVQSLVHKAEHPRWRCWTNPAAGRPAGLGIPAFGVSDIRHLRSAHLGATEMFSRVNRAFQLPLLLNTIDSVCRIIFYTSEVTYHLANVMRDKRTGLTYGSSMLYSCYWGMRIVRLWYLHSCEYYITKMIIPIRISLSWLTLTLNPVTSRRLMPEYFRNNSLIAIIFFLNALQIILFQNQLDAISSKFQIYGMMNINIAFFYGGFGLLVAYVIFLLQFFGSPLQPSMTFNNFTTASSILAFKNSTNAS